MASNGQRTARELILAQVGHLAEEEFTMPGPEGPVPILIRELTGKQSKDFEIAVGKGNQHALGMLLQMCVVDPETGELMFGPEDRGLLEELGMTTLKPIVEQAQRLSGTSDADIAKAKQDLLTARPIA